MRTTPVWIGVVGTAYCIVLAVLMLFAYLALVLSVPGAGDGQKWARSFNYICSGGIAYAATSASTLLVFALARRFYLGMLVAVLLGVLCAVASAYWPEPWFALG